MYALKWCVFLSRYDPSDMHSDFVIGFLVSMVAIFWVPLIRAHFAGCSGFRHIKYTKTTYQLTDISVGERIFNINNYCISFLQQLYLIIYEFYILLYLKTF